MTASLLENKSQPVCADEDLDSYLRQIRQYPMLDEQQERLLAVRCAAGDCDAIRDMVTANLRLVVHTAREYAGRGVALMDLVQEGSIGLLIAARKFDPDRQTRFSTYATKWIRRCIDRAVLEHAQPIRVPVHTAEAMRKLKVQAKALLQQLEREPTQEELAQQCQMSPQKVRELMDLMPQIRSLDSPAGEAEDPLGGMMEDALAPQPHQELVRQELKAVIGSLLGRLDDRQAYLLRLRFGMEDGISYSLEAVGKKLGVSKERARQLEQRALEKLRSLGLGLGLEDFLE